MEDAEMTQYNTVEKEAVLEAEFDEEMYRAARPHLKEALECTLMLGRSAHDWGEFCLENFGDAVTPYLKRFLDDLEPHTLKIERRSESTWQSSFGAEVTPDERERRVREAAFFRAERRGFVGGSPEQDWIAAEIDIDLQIAEQTGIFDQGCEVAPSLGELALKGFDSIGDPLRTWMARRSDTEGQQVA
jgi:hypothetical protein